MSLNLPTNFENDIQGKDTNLVPLVWIGNHTVVGLPPQDWIFLSTNQFLVDTITNQYTKPLLLNIPSLKESIDIEKRNYKISNVSLQLSNAEYDGVRLTDIIANAPSDSRARNSSLINTECRIFWVSPTSDI